MTDQIHRIADKPPVFPCWLWPGDAVYCKPQWVHRAGYAPDPVPTWYTHWSPDSPTAPEVRPDATQQEAAHARVMAACEEARKAVGKLPYGGPERQELHDSAMAKINASTPSPAAIAAAREIIAVSPTNGANGQTIGCATFKEIAAIIDRHFPAQSRP